MKNTDFSFITIVGTIDSIVYSESNKMYTFKLVTQNKHYLIDDSEDGTPQARVTSTINGVTKLRRFSEVVVGDRIAIQGTLNTNNDNGQLFVVLEDFNVLKKCID